MELFALFFKHLKLLTEQAGHYSKYPEAERSHHLREMTILI